MSVIAKRSSDNHFFFVCTFILALFSVVVLSVEIEKEFIASGGSSGPQDIFSQVLGSAKEGIGDILFLKADDYHHAGVTREFVPEETSEDAHKEGIIEEKHDQHTESLRTEDWIKQLNRQVRSYEHRHLTKEEEKETLPFMMWAVALDPYNIEALLTTAYSLQSDFGKPDEAMDLLIKGHQDNPTSWEICFNLANLYFRHKKDYMQSERFYREAITLSAGQKLMKDQLAHMVYFLAESCSYQGKKDEALAQYKKSLESFEDNEPLPLKAKIAKKISELT